MEKQTIQNPNFFYQKSEFPFLHDLEKNYEQILQELLELLNLNVKPFWMKTFPEYVESENKQAWRVFTFLLYGSLFYLMKSPKHAQLCPKTSELIFNIPQIISCDFSLLPAKTRINPHKGYSKMILRVHLPLIVPIGNLCGLKVGNEIHHWKEGELVIFDDSFVHEAWNDSNEPRVVLMFDIPNPRWGYTPEEISKYKIEHMDDPFLLGLATKKEWMNAFINRVLPLEEF